MCVATLPIRRKIGTRDAGESQDAGTGMTGAGRPVLLHIFRRSGQPCRDLPEGIARTKCVDRHDAEVRATTVHDPSCEVQPGPATPRPQSHLAVPAL